MKEATVFLNYLNVVAFLALIVVVIIKKIYRSNPMMTAVIATTAFFSCFFDVIYTVGHITHWNLYPVYFYTYWSVFVLYSVFVLLAMREIFSFLIAPITNVSRFARVCFKWVAFAASILALSMVATTSNSGFNIASFAMTLMRTVSLLEILLLAFVVFATQALELPLSSRIFGYSFGLGLVAATDFVAAVFSANSHTVYSWTSIVQVVSGIVAGIVWIGYSLHTEPERRPVELPMDICNWTWLDFNTATGQASGD
jgi:hypothetical protein